MTTLRVPGFLSQAVLRRLSAAEFDRLVAAGVFAEDEPLELLDGYLVTKMPKNPPHDSCLQLLEEALRPLLPTGWCLRNQSTLLLPTSRPEPDLCVVRGSGRSYVAQHPSAGDVGLLIEVADTSLSLDRLDKARLYAEAGIDIYWIVNFVDRQIEVHTSPSGQGYGQFSVYSATQAVPVLLEGVPLASLPVHEVLP